MSRMNRLAPIAGAFLLGYLSGYLFSETRQAQSSVPQESNNIFGILVHASSLPIPKQNLSCRIERAAKNTTTAHPETTLGDYIAAYLRWSQEKTRDSSTSLACEGGTVKHCIWVFGESKASEGWGEFWSLSTT